MPKKLQISLERKSLYLSLKTRELRLAKCVAGVLDLPVATMEKLPNLNETDLRKMLAIDLDCEETLDLKDFDWKLLSAKLLEREKTLQHTDASQKIAKRQKN